MSDFKDQVAPWIGVLAILGFGAFVMFLLQHLGDTEPQWSRMVFIFGAVEAAGLAGLGFFFGKEVNRARAEKAEANVTTATNAATTAATDKASTQAKLTALVRYIETQSPRPTLGSSAILDEIDSILGRAGADPQMPEVAALVAAARSAASRSEPDAHWRALKEFAKSL
jgi:hypothetical protein